MKIFIAASYSSYVNYETGEVFPEYKDWLEGQLSQIEQFGHTVFCAMREDKYKIDNADPAKAFKLDTDHIKQSEAVLALVNEKVSAGVQTEIGYALALGKKVFIAHEKDVELSWFNRAILLSGQASEIELPISKASLK